MNVDWERHLDLDLEYNKLLAPELAKADVVTLFSQNFSYDQEWFFQEPVTSLEALKGKLVRTGGPMVDHIIKKFGGTPILVEPTAVYQSAERGVFDALNMGVATFSGNKLWEVMPHLLVVQTFYGNAMYAMNKAKFDSLSKEDQQTLIDVGTETAKWLKPKYEAWINEQVGNAVMRMHGTAHALSPEERKRQIEFAAEGWNEKIETACGQDLGKQLRGLWARYEAK